MEKTYNQIYYERNKERERARVRKYRAENREACIARHRKWYKENGKQNRLKHLDKERKRALDWWRKDYENNPEKYRLIRLKNREKAKEYRLKNKEKIAQYLKEYAPKYFKMKLASDINYRLRWLLRGRISAAFKKNVKDKAFKTMELIGCTVIEAKQHIQNQFTKDMSWDNHGKIWEIDHIIPVSSFDLTKPEEQKKAFNYKNLQPLIKIENRRKGDRIII